MIDGEYIPLREVSGGEVGGEYTDEAYVRGHVDDETFRAVVTAERLGYDEDYEYDYERSIHGYARWEFAGQDGDGSPSRTLQWYPKPGRGCFKVTMAMQSSHVREAERVRQQEAQDRAFLLARYVGVEIVKANGYGRHYELRVPGLAHTITMAWQTSGPAKGELHGWAHGDDVDAWDAFRQRCSDLARISEPERARVARAVISGAFVFDYVREYGPAWYGDDRGIAGVVRHYAPGLGDVLTRVGFMPQTEAS